MLKVEEVIGMFYDIFSRCGPSLWHRTRAKCESKTVQEESLRATILLVIAIQQFLFSRQERQDPVKSFFISLPKATKNPGTPLKGGFGGPTT
jgi:hypothetical protein